MPEIAVKNPNRRFSRITTKNIMKDLLKIFVLLIFFSGQAYSQAILELDARQSMCITGKGPGQDGAINPYIAEKSIAIVKNMDKNTFEARIQKKGEIIEIVKILPGKSKEIILELGYVLYFDTDDKAKAEISFKRFEE